MDKKKYIACNEGYEKKGGIGQKPTVPRPQPPKGQGQTQKPQANSNN